MDNRTIVVGHFQESSFFSVFTSNHHVVGCSASLVVLHGDRLSGLQLTIRARQSRNSEHFLSVYFFSKFLHVRMGPGARILGKQTLDGRKCSEECPARRLAREAWCCAFPLLAGRTQGQDTFVQAKMIVDELLVLQHSDVPKNNQHGGSTRTQSDRRSQCGSRSQVRR